MAANPRVKALQSRELPSASQAAEPDIILRADEPRSDVAQSESHPPRESSASSHEAIARSAYFLAEARGFEPGYELDDWLAAERQSGLG